MGYDLRKSLFSWRFLVLFAVQLFLYCYPRRLTLSLVGPGQNFFRLWLLLTGGINVSVLALLCSGLVGMQTYDELDKNFQHLLFSRTSLGSWMKRKFFVNCLVGGIFIALAWAVLLAFCYYLTYPPKLEYNSNTMDLYHTIVSEDPFVALVQYICLELLRAFIFGVMTGAVATLGAVMIKSRYLALAFPFVVFFIFDYFIIRIFGFVKLSLFVNFIVTATSRVMGPWFSFFYLGLLCLLFLCLANFFVLRRVYNE